MARKKDWNELDLEGKQKRLGKALRCLEIEEIKDYLLKYVEKNNLREEEKIKYLILNNDGDKYRKKNAKTKLEFTERKKLEKLYKDGVEVKKIAE